MLFRLYLGRKRTLKIFSLIEKESDLFKFCQINKYTERTKIIFIPQFDSGDSIGHFVLNIVDMKEKTIYLMNSLDEWNVLFCPAKVMFKEFNGPLKLETPQQPENSLQCGFRMLFNIFKSIESYLLNYSLSFEFNDDEFNSFSEFIVDLHNTFIKLSSFHWKQIQKEKHSF